MQAPHSIGVNASPAAVKGLSAYTNSADFLLAPSGMACSGIVAADGGSGVTVWARGAPIKTQHADHEGLTLSVQPACSSCRADEACPFFTALASTLGWPCHTEPPARELVVHQGARLVLFSDPPWVAGSGWPSGGHDPAHGLVAVFGGKYDEVVRATCTLPQADHELCTTSLNDVLARHH
jgi:hypothetical protein